MIDIAFPEKRFSIKEDKGRELIFDDIRKQWLLLTPEEWVRQNFLNYLINVKRCPPSLIAVEREIHLGELKKRCDIVVYKDAKPWMIVECKEMSVKLSEPVLKQILNYNIALDVSFLIITNGKETYGLNLKEKGSKWLHEVPPFNS
jgi:hypothetical protein